MICGVTTPWSGEKSAAVQRFLVTGRYQSGRIIWGNKVAIITGS